MRTALELENLLTTHEYTSINISEAASSVNADLVKCREGEITTATFLVNTQTTKDQITGNQSLAEYEIDLETFSKAVDGLMLIAQETI